MQLDKAHSRMIHPFSHSRLDGLQGTSPNSDAVISIRNNFPHIFIIARSQSTAFEPVFLIVLRVGRFYA